MSPLCFCSANRVMLSVLVSCAATNPAGHLAPEFGECKTGVYVPWQRREASMRSTVPASFANAELLPNG